MAPKSRPQSGTPFFGPKRPKNGAQRPPASLDHLLAPKGPKVTEAAWWPKATRWQGPKALASAPFRPEGPKSGRGSQVAEGHLAQAPKGPASTPFGPERPKSGTPQPGGRRPPVPWVTYRRRFHCPAVARFEAANPLPTPHR